MPELDEELGHLAVVKGLATPTQVNDCRSAGNGAAVPMKLADVLMLRGICTQQQVTELLEALGSPQEYQPSAARIGAGAKFGRYEIVCELGRGGMGAVYKARDPLLDRTVALKILSDRLIASDEDIHRFQRESKLAARLRHPNLVQIFEAGIIDGVPFFTMEYVEGKTFDEVLVDELACQLRPDWKPQMTLEAKVRVLIKVAEAVHIVHRAGMIHRDIKPGNIIIDLCGEPRVMDFGLAREVNSGTMLTSTGVAMGTPYYMPPEQASGDVRNLDSRTDVYALGAVLYHALTLRLPFMEATAAIVLRRVIDDDPMPPTMIDPSIDRALERVVQKAMSKDRNERYLSPGEFARDLERYLAGQPVAAKSRPLLSRVKRWVAKHPTPSAVMAVAFTLVTLFATYLFIRPGRLALDTTPTGAEAFVDDIPVGRTPIDIALTRGKHEVRVRAPGHRDLQFMVDVAGGRSELRRERMEHRLGRLSIESDPPNVEVRLSGPKRVTLQTPVETLMLPAGRYHLEAFRPQYELGVVAITVGDGVDATRKIALREAQRWQFRTIEGIWRAPVVADLDKDGVPDAVVATKDGRVYALSGRDGHQLWMHDTRAPSPSEPAIHGGDVLIGVGATGFICLRGSDGAARYFVKTGTRTHVASGPEGDVVTATTQGIVTRWDGKALAALRSESKWLIKLGLAFESIQAAGGGWIARAGSDACAIEAGGTYTRAKSEPAYKLSEQGHVASASWTFRADQAVRAQPVEADIDGDGVNEVIFGADDQKLYVLDSRTGALRWYFQAGGNIAAQVAVADVTGDGLAEIIFGTTEGVVRAVSPASR